MLQNIVIPKSQHVHSKLAELQSSSLVIVRLIGIIMLPAIQLNRQSTSRTIKIHDVSADAMLSAKSVACQALESKQLPKFFFRVGWLLAHRTSEFQSTPIIIVA